MGCKANQFESAIIKENLIKNGMCEVNEPSLADFYILNSCSVTHKSDNEAFYLLRNVKNKNHNIKTILTGCIAQIEKEELLQNDYIDYVIGNNEKLHIYEYLAQDKNLFAGDIMNQTNFSEVELVDLSKTRASLKIQDGCDNRCAYCIIWKARGKSRSASLDFIVNQINHFADSGFKEVILTGIHIGQWGKDLNLKFIDLINAIENRTHIKRYRLGSLNPTEINDELLFSLKKSQKFCPHFHLSLQSANDKTLKSMNRFYTTEKFLKQIEQINKIFELPFIGCDIITGFAGETDEDFEITRKNLEYSGLTQIHTFPYSIRKGTIGASMKDQIPEKTKQNRADVIKQISKNKYNQFIQNNIGKKYELLIEKHRSKHTGNLKGMTRNYLPVEIITDSESYYNTLQNVEIQEYKDNIIYAQIINN